MAHPILRWRAATALDLTHAVSDRGPRTFNARKLVADWLDGTAPYSRKVRSAVNWLENVAEKCA